MKFWTLKRINSFLGHLIYYILFASLMSWIGLIKEPSMYIVTIVLSVMVYWIMELMEYGLEKDNGR